MARQATVRFGVLAAAGGLLLAGCASSGSLHASGSGGAQSSGSPTKSAPAAAPVVSGCTAPKAETNPHLSWPAEPKMTIDKAKAYTMTLHTDCGDIVIAMDAAKAPHAVNSFNFLASQKYFDGSFCHRLSTEGMQMLQCGDAGVGATPGGRDGTGTPGYRFADENLAGATYRAGTVAMANAGPGTNGSQFFLVFGDAALSPDYTPFGKITSGMDILTKVAAAGIAEPRLADGTGRPNQPVELESVTVTAG
jgi:peptidyl-prolyl cis-trans isomerase B (cyclophilin B)